MNPNIDLGVIGPPAGKVRANVLFWGGFGIAATTESLEAVWRFLRNAAHARPLRRPSTTSRHKNGRDSAQSLP